MRLFHLWNGSQISHKSDAEWSDGKYGWFMEGFTDYYSGATLYREGILDGPGFAAFLNRLIVDYAQNGESLRSTTEDLGSQRWRDRDHQRLPYTKGALLGLLMDLQLRKNGRTLDDYMRAMLRKPDYDMSDLRGAWLALAGEPGDAKVVAVESGSSAEKAGIRIGDSLRSFSVYHGDTSKEAKFGLLRGSGRVDVAYLPVTTRTVVQVTGGLDALRSLGGI